MAYPNTVDIKDAAGVTRTVAAVAAKGRQPGTNGVPVTIDNESFGLFDALSTAMASMASAMADMSAVMGAPATSLPPFAPGLLNRFTPKIVDLSSSAETNAIAGVAGDTIRVHYFRLLTPVAANELAVWNGPITDAAQLDLLSFSGAGAGHTYGSASDPIWVTSADKGLVFKPTGTARITGLLLYTQD